MCPKYVHVVGHKFTLRTSDVDYYWLIHLVLFWHDATLTLTEVVRHVRLRKANTSRTPVPTRRPLGVRVRVLA